MGLGARERTAQDDGGVLAAQRGPICRTGGPGTGGSQSEPRRQATTLAPEDKQSRTCEIPGYPSPSNVENLGLSWCGSNVDFQRRAFALQAAGAWCAIAGGTSSSPDQIAARHGEIEAACDRLDAMQSPGTPTCRCPSGYRP